MHIPFRRRYVRSVTKMFRPLQGTHGNPVFESMRVSFLKRSLVSHVAACCATNMEANQAEQSLPLEASQELCSAVPQDREKVRSAKAWANYQAFLESPGGKCPHCWLMRRHCCCEGLPKLILRLRVVVLLHHLEIGQRKASNTAKLLAHFGAELLCWGVEEHDARLLQIIDEDMEGTVVLFPSQGPRRSEASELAPERAAPVRPVRQVLVLDGGWRECVRMNAWISRGHSRFQRAKDVKTSCCTALHCQRLNLFKKQVRRKCPSSDCFVYAVSDLKDVVCQIP
ncbi:unnamed protein product [Durusdinium trenchii]|uniref:tRNA-uridine aminocarboxypropyltransferase n=1 Tax=Durusdinium trenchii TaxID=1381693 RepID=A0ABP0M1V7_9DINO